jgi:PiT family inorganic phosphate transporter
VGAAAALVVVWLGTWGVMIDALLAVLIVLALFLRSRRNSVNASNAMSEVADSGKAVKVKRNPPPTRRQRAIAREEAREAARKAASERRVSGKKGQK